MSDKVARAGDARTDAASTPTAVLLTLADRCEREEPSDGLSVAIFHAITQPRDRRPEQWPPYATSLDAAATLVPAGHVWRAGAGVNGYADVGKRGLGFVDNDGNPLADHTWAKTPAMALCAAALRARAAVQP